MKLVRFEHEGQVRSGMMEEGGILSDEGSLPLEEVILLPPVEPSKIVCVGLNYKDHAAELDMPVPDEPVIFMKPPTAIIADGENIIYPKAAARVDYEAELAIVIKEKARNVSRTAASDYIQGYTCFNDVTARDLQKKDGQWTRAKSFDTFAPIGPWIETELDPSDIAIQTYLNGEIKQDSRTSEFIFDVYDIVSFVSGVMTLLPGDVIATGTPAKIGPMVPGDQVMIKVEGIGSLTNSVVGA